LMIPSFFKHPIRMPLYLYAVILLLLALPSIFVSSGLIRAVYTCYVLQNADFKYIVSGETGDYIRLSNYYITGEGITLNAELYMPEEGAQAAGYFARDHRLRPAELPGEGECAVSRGLALRNGLKIGDTLALKSTLIGRGTIQVTISAYLPSVNGLRTDAVTEGLILLGHDDEIVPSGGDTRISFIQEIPLTAENLVYQSVMIRELRQSALFASLWILFAAALEIFVMEAVFQRNKLHDYRYFYQKGMGRGRLARLITLELVIKYAPPILFAGVVTSLVYVAAYGGAAFAYAGVLAACGAAGIAASAVYDCVGSFLWIR